eukprot:m.174788 g.174788  ORF g.174788 m.174788 type:complete len:975 (+) comp39118_c0_seq15:3105-6029(+)
MATDQFSRGKGRLSEGLTSLQQLASICTKFKEQLEAQLIQKRSVEEKKRQKIAARFSELTSELENLQRLFLSELRKEAASRTQLLEGRLLETEGTRKGVIHVTSEVTSLLDVKEKQLFFSRFCPTSALLQSCIDKLILLEANEMGAEVEEVESPWLCESKCENVYEAVFKLLANSEGSVAVEQTGPDLGTDEAVALKVESLSISEDDKRSTMSPALSISSGSSTSCSFPSFPISNSCYFHAVVTDVESPSNFWLQCVSDQHNEMMAQLETTYSKHQSHRFCPTKGHTCAAKYSKDQSWNRALVQDFIAVPFKRNSSQENSSKQSPALIDAFFVDLGISETVPLSDVHHLRREFYQLPCQALHCRLSRRWWDSAGDVFRDVIFSQEQVICQVVAAPMNVDELALVDLHFACEDKKKSLHEMMADSLLSLVKPPSSIHQKASACLKQPVIPTGQLEFPVVFAAGMPNDFYVYINSEETKIFSDFLIAMNAHYEEKALTGDLCPVAHVQLDAAYAVWSNDQWTRGIAVLDEGDDVVQMQLVDFGVREAFPLKDTFPLDPQFLDLPALTVKCCLAGVHPPWSDAAIQLFRELTGEDNVLYAEVLGDESTDKGGSAESSFALSIRLYDKSEGKNVCVNEFLGAPPRQGAPANKTVIPAELGNENDQPDSSCDEFSPRTVIPAEFDNAKDQPELGGDKFSEWNPMMRDFTSQQNFYGLSSDLNFALHGHASFPTEHPVCRFFLRGQVCRHGQDCRYSHDIEVLRTKCGPGSLCVASLPEDSSWVPVVITAVESPAHFFAQLLSDCQKQSLDDLFENVSWSSVMAEDFLELLEKNSVNGERLNPAMTFDCGEMVAARSQIDGKWYRALVVSELNAEYMVKVFYVDYGDMELLEESRLSALNPVFFHFPVQAVECKLRHVSPVQSEWSTDSKDLFIRKTREKVLFAYIHSRDGIVLNVDLYDTTQPEDVCIRDKLVKFGYAR